MGVFFCSTATTKTSMRFIGISGSLRKASTNTGVLRYASEAFSKAGHEFSIVNIGHLPFMNEDLEVGGLPEDVLNFKKEVESADGVLFGCPEYNYGVTPAMKNALDWASRSGNSWAGKPAGIVFWWWFWNWKITISSSSIFYLFRC